MPRKQLELSMITRPEGTARGGIRPGQAKPLPASGLGILGRPVWRYTRVGSAPRNAAWAGYSTGATPGVALIITDMDGNTVEHEDNE